MVFYSGAVGSLETFLYDAQFNGAMLYVHSWCYVLLHDGLIDSSMKSTVYVGGICRCCVQGSDVSSPHWNVAIKRAE